MQMWLLAFIQQPHWAEPPTPAPPFSTTCTKIQSLQKIWRINFSSTYERHEGPGATGAAGLRHPRAIGSVSTRSLISKALLGHPPPHLPPPKKKKKKKQLHCLSGPYPSSPSFHRCLSCSFQPRWSLCSADGRIPSTGERNKGRLDLKEKPYLKNIQPLFQLQYYKNN